MNVGKTDKARRLIAASIANTVAIVVDYAMNTDTAGAFEASACKRIIDRPHDPSRAPVIFRKESKTWLTLAAQLVHGAVAPEDAERQSRDFNASLCKAGALARLSSSNGCHNPELAIVKK